MEDIACACHRFYVAHFDREMTILRERKFVDNEWAGVVAGLLGSESRKKQVEEGRAFLLRLGRHSGAESVTLNGVRRIKILEGQDPETRKMRSSEQPEAKTIWLAGDDPNTSENMLPFGWALAEITPEGSEPSHWAEPFDEYHKPAREWCKKLDARLGELRLQQAEEDRRRLAMEEQTCREAEAHAAEIARVAALGPEDRRIAEIRQRFEDARQRNDRKAGGALSQLFNAIIEEAKSWSAANRQAVIPLLDEIDKFLEGDRKKRRARIQGLLP
jgi:CRISPR-associated protein Csm5